VTSLHIIYILSKTVGEYDCGIIKPARTIRHTMIMRLYDIDQSKTKFRRVIGYREQPT